MPTFHSAELEAAFAADGYVLLPLLGADEVGRLAELASGFAPSSGPTTFSDHTVAAAGRAHLRDAIDAIVGPPARTLLAGHRTVSASLVFKPPGAEGDLEWHCDPSMTDERVASSLSFWIPLIDVDGTNGSLEVLQGGHLGAPLHRGGLGAIPATYPTHAEALRSSTAGGGRATGPLSVAAGSAVAYDHRLPHRSGANAVDAVRPAVNVAFLPIGAPLLLHVWRDPTTVDAIAVPDDFLATQSVAGPPAEWHGTRLAHTLHRPGRTGP